MGSVLDSRCPQCGAVRPINPPTTTVTPINTNSPVTAPLTPIVGQVIPINQPQVQQIGQVQSIGQQTCPRCGTANSGAALACSSCGVFLSQPMPASTSTRAPRSRIVAALLGLFLGFFGVQYFYMGRRPLGFFCLALCWTGFPGAVGFMEGLRLLVIDDAQFARECVG
jgi:hypothetical protein